MTATAVVLTGAGAAVARAGSTDEPSGTPDSAAAASVPAPVPSSVDPAAALQAYVTSMSAHERTLEQRVAAARDRIAHLRAVRAARVEAAQVAAVAVAAPRGMAAPSTGASAPADRDDDGREHDDEHEDEHHDEHHDDGGELDDD
jgi:hypothetical protein